ncbi:MAG: response regulator [Elusimicrobiota bacterium]|nr:MAG: response regulator [Elusimicrobiota bacterium]
MTNAKITVLLVEKDPQVAQLLLLLMTEPVLPSPQFSLVCADGPETARRVLREDPAIQVVLLGSGVRALGALPTPTVAVADYRSGNVLDARALKRALSVAAARRPSSRGASRGDDMPTPRRRRVILVDDDGDFSSLLKDWLLPRYDVVVLPRGDDLLDEMIVVEPDLVVLDVSMPGPDGFTLCRRVRAEPRFAETPVLFLTSSNRAADFVDNLDAGGSAYVVKPVERRSLLARVAGLLP